MLSRRRRLLIGRLARRKTREREGCYIAEGLRCAGTVLRAGAEVRFAVAARSLADAPESRDLMAALAERSVEVDLIADQEFAEIAATRTPQGILLVCAEGTPGDFPTAPEPVRTLVLDAVQDPGNVGTLIRVAAAFGLSAVIALDGTADPYGPKSVRASAGHVASVPLFRWSWERAAEVLGRADTPLLAGVESGRPVGPAAGRGSWALVLGNEGAGVRAEVANAATAVVAVPVRETVDSLNVGVAGAILLYALTGGGTAAGDGHEPGGRE